MQKSCSIDTLCNGQLLLAQRTSGYRVSLDPFLLAYFTPKRTYNSILDVGSGVGTIALLLKLYHPLASITALEQNEELSEICRHNSYLNHQKIDIVCADLQDNPLKTQQFDLVVTNPPFYEKNSHRLSSTRTTTDFETLPLAQWISLCIARLNHHGTFSIIHLASRLDEILSILNRKLGNIEVIPIYSKKNQPANRVIVTAKKGSSIALKLSPGIVVHEDSGEYSSIIQKILTGNFVQNKQ